MNPELLEFAGLVGVAFYISSYAMLQAGLLRGSGYAYAILNLLAASLVLVSLFAAFNRSSAIIQIFWIVISVLGIGRKIWHHHRVKFSEDEEHLLRILFPTIEKPLARKFLDLGVWCDLEPGATLTVEGASVTEMSYLATGQAKAYSHGTEIGVVNKGLVGEINVLTQGLASATVEITQPSRVLVFAGTPLRQLSERDAEFRLALEAAMKQETGEKLRRANERLASTQ